MAALTGFSHQELLQARLRAAAGEDEGLGRTLQALHLLSDSLAVHLEQNGWSQTDSYAALMLELGAIGHRHANRLLP